MAGRHRLNTRALPYLKVCTMISAQLLCIRVAGDRLSGRFMNDRAHGNDKDYIRHIEKSAWSSACGDQR